MAIALSTAGIKVKYASVTAGGTRPSTGYTEIPGIKAIPEFNPEPNNLQVTPLSETEYHQYISGLKDIGSAIGLTVNMDNAFKTAWDGIIDEYDGGAKDIWIEYAVPGMTDSFYFMAEPIELGFGGAEVDSVFENTAYLMPNKVEGWAAKSN